MALGDLTSPDAVVAALDEFDELGRDEFLKKYGFGGARRYFLRRDGRYYDSKAIVGAAYGYQYRDRGPLAYTQFSAGEHTVKAKLEELGFDMVVRRPKDALALRDALAASLTALQERTPGEWSDDLQRMVALMFPDALRETVPSDYRVKGSAGAGNQAEVPWVSVMPPGTKGASEGTYVVYLFAADGSRVYLSLSQAVTGQAKRDLPQLAEKLRAAAGAQPDLASQIELGARGPLAERYELATAYAIEYRAEALPDEAQLVDELERFLDLLTAVGATAVGTRAWLFQSNPDRYRIDDAIRERAEVTWTVRQSGKSIHAGDRVYIWRSGKQAGVVAVGSVLDDPSLRPHDADDPYWLDASGFTEAEPQVRVSIEQLLDPPLLRDQLLQHPLLDKLQILKFANATNFGVTPEQDAALLELIGENWVPGLAQLTEVAPREFPAVTQALADELYLPAAWLQETLELLGEKRQVVFYGPPGTGKTKVALELAKHITADGGEFRIVQFHPSYSYEDFFEGYRPSMAGEQMQFVLSPGPLRQIARAAQDDPRHPYVLVIDEINRGNIPKIFGELLFLLEYRSEVVRPQYSPSLPFSLPRNLFLIGTMNTADRSIALVDAALRRRFYFKAFLPTEEPVSSVLGKWLQAHQLADEPARLLTELNREIGQQDVSIGPSYFMTTDGSAPDLERVWRYSVLPLLEEYYYGAGRDVASEFSLARLRQRISAGEPGSAEASLLLEEGAAADETPE
jgi:predicted RNA-binding protein with PUA-like domain